MNTIKHATTACIQFVIITTTLFLTDRLTDRLQSTTPPTRRPGTDNELGGQIRPTWRFSQGRKSGVTWFRSMDLGSEHLMGP